MPKIQMGKTEGVIVWDENDFYPGYAPQGGKTSGGAVKASSGYSYATNLDVYRNVGYAQPGLNYATATLAATQLANTYGMALTINTSDKGYIITANGKVLEYDYTSNALTNAGNYPHTIAHGAHATFVGRDGIIYQHNVGGTLTRDYFYAFTDATDWDIGLLKPASDTFDDDYMSTVPATPLAGSDLTYGKDYPHPMAIGSDDVLYIGSGRYLHGYDGSLGNDGTFQANVLTLPQGFIITALLQTPTNLLIGGIYANTTTPLVTPLNNEARVYTWNYLDQDIGACISADDGYLASLMNFRGVPTAVTAGYVLNRGGVRVKVLSGDYFQTVAELPTSVPPLFRGVDIVSTQMFLNCAGLIYTVGSPFDRNYQVNQPVRGVNTGDSGFLKNIYFGSTSSRNITSSSTADVSVYRTGYAEAAALYTTIAEPAFPDLHQGRLTKIVVYYRYTATGGRTIAILAVPETGTQTVIQSATGTIASPAIKKFEVDSSGKPLPFFKDLFFIFNWASGAGATDAPVLSKIEAYFEYVAYQDGAQT